MLKVRRWSGTTVIALNETANTKRMVPMKSKAPVQSVGGGCELRADVLAVGE